eukprot:Skav214067  [mRNA]  locus=scaffold2017:910060:910224:- [translate_table: standard]
MEAGADCNQATDNDTTPLYVAARNGHLEIVRLLRAAGADVDAQCFTRFGKNFAG